MDEFRTDGMDEHTRIRAVISVLQFMQLRASRVISRKISHSAIYWKIFSLTIK